MLGFDAIALTHRVIASPVHEDWKSSIEAIRLTVSLRGRDNAAAMS
jgi:hypothetical protein